MMKLQCAHEAIGIVGNVFISPAFVVSMNNFEAAF